MSWTTFFTGIAAAASGFVATIAEPDIWQAGWVAVAILFSLDAVYRVVQEK